MSKTELKVATELCAIWIKKKYRAPIQVIPSYGNWCQNTVKWKDKEKENSNSRRLHAWYSNSLKLVSVCSVQLNIGSFSFTQVRVFVPIFDQKYNLFPAFHNDVKIFPPYFKANDSKWTVGVDHRQLLDVCGEAVAVCSVSLQGPLISSFVSAKHFLQKASEMWAERWVITEAFEPAEWIPSLEKKNCQHWLSSPRLATRWQQIIQYPDRWKVNLCESCSRSDVNPSSSIFKGHILFCKRASAREISASHLDRFGKVFDMFSLCSLSRDGITPT